ncbi:uncharacterized protein LOC118756617 [Rhagoletis pomonella]|uniref:uncharacterized protein LOC118756617 n=1 Tax=Rhagoletis pomonella TaxID=28610 RepID=UPI0017807409|nr:uncharacterized protein LOC118756617 [Rhagoletis pomonella]
MHILSVIYSPISHAYFLYIHNYFHFSLFLCAAEKVEKVSIDLDSKTVLVTSNLTSEELLETIKKTGKATQYVGVKE